MGESGHPIVGERVYIRDYHGKLIDAPRIMLHAAVLGFEHPTKGSTLRFEEPMPDDMKEVLESLRDAPNP